MVSKTLIFKNPYPPDTFYEQDIKRIQEVIEKIGYKISEDDAMLAWKEYSDAFAASWILLPEDDATIWRNIERYLVVKE